MLVTVSQKQAEKFLGSQNPGGWTMKRERMNFLDGKIQDPSLPWRYTEIFKQNEKVMMEIEKGSHGTFFRILDMHNEMFGMKNV